MYENLALSDNGFLFDTRTGNTFSLSKTATFLLKGLMGGASPQQLAEQAAETFDVDVQTASRDVARFVFRLRDLRLLPPDSVEDPGGFVEAVPCR